MMGKRNKSNVGKKEKNNANGEGMSIVSVDIYKSPRKNQNTASIAVYIV